MKRLSICFAVTVFSVLLVSGSLLSQDYHPFPDNKIRIYELEYYNQPWESFAIQINTRDTIDGDEVLNLNNQVINDYSHDFLPPCLIADSGSWFAKFLRISLSSGGMVIYNEKVFPLSTPLDREVDEMLVAAFLQDGHFVVVTVVDESEKMVLGKEEMVKEFLFEVLRQSDQEPNPDHYLHEKRIKIGAESGLIESFTFNVPETENPLKGVLKLKQIADTMDEVRPGITELFPFGKGDSLHVLETKETAAENVRNEIRYEILERDYDVVLGKLSFSVRKEYSNYENNMGEVMEDAGVDTVEWIVDSENYLDIKLPVSFAELLPGEQELTEDNDNIELNYYHLRSGENSQFDRREVHFFHEWMFVDGSQNCPFYAAPLDLPSYYSKHFIEGLGGPYFYINDVMRKPVFASVGGERWGEPLDFPVSVDEITDEQIAMKLFPNPILSGEKLTVKTNNFGEKLIDIYSVQGTKVHSVFGPEDTFTISTSMLPKGTYILKVIEANSPPVTQKFIVR